MVSQCAEGARSATQSCCAEIRLPVKGRVARWLDLLVKVSTDQVQRCIAQGWGYACMSTEVSSCCHCVSSPCSSSSSNMY